MGEGALSGFRVIDLTGSRGAYCGRLLAGLGADVILVEPPGGDPLRRQPPFKDDIPHPEGSLAFSAYHANKRGLVLDLEAGAGRETLLGLAAGADVLIEDRPAGQLSSLGLGWEEVRAASPRLVYASITGFGQSGPYSGFADPEIVVFAMGGLMSFSGHPGRPPVTGPDGIGYKLACVHAAFGILVALFNRAAAGGGQHVEVSAQEVLVADPFRRLVTQFSVTGEIVQRLGTRVGMVVNSTYRCLDGWVAVDVLQADQWQRFLEWLGGPAELADPALGPLTPDARVADVAARILTQRTQGSTREEVAGELQALRLPAAAVNSPGEFLADRQTVERGFVMEVDHPHLGRHGEPGEPYLMSATPWRIERCAPLLGEHQDEIEGELRPSAPALDGPASARGLAGIRVVCFPTGIVGPCLARLLADHGAEVIAISSNLRGGAWRNGRQQLASEAESHRNLKRVTINMGDAQGRELARRLIARADVLAENFSSRVMRNWELDYPHVSAGNPGLVMISLNSFGNRGPRGDQVSFGPILMGYCGMFHAWRDPDVLEPGVGIHTAFPDYLSPSYGALAVMAALHHRERSGRGQYIDLSQGEAGAALLGTCHLEWLVNGRDAEPLGNSSPVAAPHGCYPARGSDAWCVIAVETDDQWERFCEATGHPEWRSDPRFESLAARLANRAALDALVGGWTAERTATQVMLTLQHEGVGAGVVQNGEDLYRDPHLRQRGFVRDVQHPEVGWMAQVGATVGLSATPARVRHQAPSAGADNEAVFGALLDLTAGEIADLAERQVLA